MSPVTIIAIDPGASGAMAVLTPERRLATFPYRSPTQAKHDYADVWRAAVARGLIIHVMEQVHASPVMSPSSAFAFGENFGIWRGILAGVTVYSVTPSQWQREMGIPPVVQGPVRKRELKRIASQRYPDDHVTLSTCDAILIADYVWREIEAKGGFTSGKSL